MHHDEEMQAFIVELAQFVARVFVCLSRPDVVKALDVALLKQHGLQLMQRFQHLLTWLTRLSTLFYFLEHRFACRSTR